MNFIIMKYTVEKQGFGDYRFLFGVPKDYKLLKDFSRHVNFDECCDDLKKLYVEEVMDLWYKGWQGKIL